mgnify:CR=1 FL=1
MTEGECEVCGEPSQYEERIWGVLEWCADCEEEAAWYIYSDAAETTDRYWIEQAARERVNEEEE